MLRFLIRAFFYPTLWFNRLMCALGLWRPWDWIDEHVAVGNLPTRHRLEELARENVGGIINLCEEHPGHAAKLQAVGIAQLHLPTLDYHSPSAADVERGLAFIKAQIAQGKKTYIHCKAGRGRSATIALCYLIDADGLTVDQAYARLKQVRPQVDNNIRDREVVHATARRVQDAVDES